jgi:DNA-binding winged helix-turn-helix (wHTH) protein
METGPFYRFGAFSLDAGQRVLLRNGEVLSLPPKDLETLLVLVQHSGQLVEKGELLEKVWPGTFVEEGNLARHISNLC